MNGQKVTRGVWISWLLLALALPAVTSAVSAEPKHFPNLTGRNLLGQPISLPAQLPADPEIVLLGLSEAQQASVTHWIDALEAQRPGVAWLEIAVIGPVNAFVQGMIGAAMRRSITDFGRRARVITWFEPPDVLLNTLGCQKSERDVCVAVVARSGQVRAVLQGAPDAELVRRALDVLDQP